MGTSKTTSNALRRFLQSILTLRAQMNDEEFKALCEWIEFIASEQPAPH